MKSENELKREIDSSLIIKGYKLMFLIFKNNNKLNKYMFFIVFGIGGLYSIVQNEIPSWLKITASVYAIMFIAFIFISAFFHFSLSFKIKKLSQSYNKSEKEILNLL
jgi:preprotein translocase subunit SecY